VIFLGHLASLAAKEIGAPELHHKSTRLLPLSVAAMLGDDREWPMSTADFVRMARLHFEACRARYVYAVHVEGSRERVV
jgi:hypothetical protein